MYQRGGTRKDLVPTTAAAVVNTPYFSSIFSGACHPVLKFFFVVFGTGRVRICRLPPLASTLPAPLEKRWAAEFPACLPALLSPEGVLGDPFR